MEWIEFNGQNIGKYEKFIKDQKYAGIWHQPDWLSFQKASGRITNGFFFGIGDGGNIILSGLILVMKTKIGKYIYIPAGIVSETMDKSVYDFFIANLKKAASKYGAFFTRTDSITPYSEEYEKILSSHKEHIPYFKPPIPQFTNMIDLSPSLEDIMANMKPKGRYNIKLAEKKGVVLKRGGVDDIPAFYRLLKETTQRDGFLPNPESYYKLMLETIKNSTLLLAYHENDLLCANIFTFSGNQGLYYYGASSNVKRNLMAPYLVQWEAIRMAKEHGCKYFDFMGIADPADPNDRLAGVTEFKLKFGGQVVKFRPSYHIIHNRLVYGIYEGLKKVF